MKLKEYYVNVDVALTILAANDIDVDSNEFKELVYKELKGMVENKDYEYELDELSK